MYRKKKLYFFLIMLKINGSNNLRQMIQMIQINSIIIDKTYLVFCLVLGYAKSVCCGGEGSTSHTEMQWINLCCL